MHNVYLHLLIEGIKGIAIEVALTYAYFKQKFKK